MTCPNCGRWSPADPETGYDADDLCPDCAPLATRSPEFGGAVVTADDECEDDECPF